MAEVRVCVVGALGRMGRRVCDALAQHPGLKLASALVRPNDLGSYQTHDEHSLGDGVLLTTDADQALREVALCIDFSAPSAAVTIAPLCAQHKVAYVLASTGLLPADEAALQKAAAQIPIMQAANFSLGVNVLREVVEYAAKTLGRAYDVEIAETHHRHKKDAPSGTALMLGRAVSAGLGGVAEIFGRHGTTPRSAHEMGYAVMRGGDVSGDHTVYFLGEGERLEFTHRASSPLIFARGAVDSGLWLLKQTPGLYGMRERLR